MIEQGSQDWHLQRAGKATASRFKDILPGKSGKYLKSRDDYMIELVTERLTGEAIIGSHGINGYYGQTAEDYARLAFEAETGIMVRESEFIDHQNIAFCGCSPDGLIVEDEGLEIKCPANSSIHLRTILTGAMPEEHIPQVQGSMSVTGRKRWHFASYDPRMPEHLRLFHIVVERDDKFIAELEKEITKFLGEVDKFMAKIPKAA